MNRQAIIDVLKKMSLSITFDSRESSRQMKEHNETKFWARC